MDRILKVVGWVGFAVLGFAGGCPALTTPRHQVVVIGGSGIFPAAAPSRHAAGLRARTGLKPTVVVLAGLVIAGQLVISAQQKPASSRAMAVTMTPVGLWWALIRRYRPHNRCCAVQDRAAVAGSTRRCRALRMAPTAGRCR